MSAWGARRLFMVLAATLFALHAQPMDIAQPLHHARTAEQSHPIHDDGRCKSGCCDESACCGQAVEAKVFEAPERRSPIFDTSPDRAAIFAALGPPDPPPRSLAA
jgi:hypothetical protein